MRRTLGTLALLLAVTGCGSDTGADSPPVEAAPEVILVSATAGGGEGEAVATDVSDDADLAAYVAQFDDAFATEVSEAARRLDGDVVLAQVVSVGCDVPPAATLQDGVIVAEKVADPKQECFAPVTTVALAG
ncbi:hypothetical protein [Nocardioides sp. SR21]|uniref:hypothetical protein n=1 Tax=Nocardioides sp. SR21 TaxID=2919501 RepID=UPI001FAAECDA|nr:hypothetical protein [Nocardioides sp. SR21]